MSACNLRNSSNSVSDSNIIIIRNFTSINGGSVYVALFRRVNDQSQQKGGDWYNVVVISNVENNVKVKAKDTGVDGGVIEDNNGPDGSFIVDGITFYYNGNVSSMHDKDYYKLYNGVVDITNVKLFSTTLEAAKYVIENSRYN